MENKRITVFEYSKLVVDNINFREKHFNALVRYNEINGNKYFTVGYRKVTFKSYVGVIQVGNLIIEILPKADNTAVNDTNAVNKWQLALPYMLKVAGFVNFNKAGTASQATRQMHLLDIFLYDFLEKVDKLIHSGLIKKYRRVQTNNMALKGRLLLPQHIRHNIIHKERFYTEHTVYDRDNAFNQILKKALEIVSSTSRNYTIQGLAKKHLIYFNNIKSIKPDKGSFKKLKYDSKTNEYKEAIELAKMIILEYSPDFTLGQEDILTILFDMNKLFEVFIYKLLKKEERYFSEYSLHVNKQTSRAFWRGKTIRPDVIINYQVKKSKEGKAEINRVVLDTKWKVLRDGLPSDADLKQMFTYNIQFGATHSILFYPATGSANLGKELFERSVSFEDFEHCCEAYFADLFKSELEINESLAKEFVQYILPKKQIGNIESMA